MTNKKFSEPKLIELYDQARDAYVAYVEDLKAKLEESGGDKRC
jgi:hypothetical protein